MNEREPPSGMESLAGVTVTTGLEPGQLVVTDGADRLKDGAKVRLAENAPAGAAQEANPAAQPAAATAPQATPGAPRPRALPPAATPNPAQQPAGQRRRQGTE